MCPRIRVLPEDFVVDELALYPPSGEGGHTFLRIEKRLRNTEDVARALARAAGCEAREIGYAGRKDRNAVTSQWFSVPGLAPETALRLELHGARVLEAHRHPHKLRTGQLRGNRFELRVRGVDAACHARARARLAELLQVGMSNRFGEQRFGRDGANAERARPLLLGERSPGRRGAPDKRAARFLISALQAEVFNRVLARRPLPLDAVETGDVAQVCESGGLFTVEDVAAEGPRAARFEISATGPIFGTKMMRPTGAVLEREQAVMAELGLPPFEQIVAPRGLRLRGGRRALRVRPTGASVGELEGDSMRLVFELGPGSYATVLLEELLGGYAEGAADAAGAGADAAALESEGQ